MAAKRNPIISKRGGCGKKGGFIASQEGRGFPENGTD